MAAGARSTGRLMPIQIFADREVNKQDGGQAWKQRPSHSGCGVLSVEGLDARRARGRKNGVEDNGQAEAEEEEEEGRSTWPRGRGGAALAERGQEAWAHGDLAARRAGGGGISGDIEAHHSDRAIRRPLPTRTPSCLAHSVFSTCTPESPLLARDAHHTGSRRRRSPAPHHHTALPPCRPTIQPGMYRRAQISPRNHVQVAAHTAPRTPNRNTRGHNRVKALVARAT